MQIKLLAVGNVLMEDDGIAIFLAEYLEDILNHLVIEVIYGETDIAYSLSRIENGDLLLILDAARLGKEAGEVTLLTSSDCEQENQALTWHDVSVANLFRLFYPDCCCYILAIEICEVDFHYGPSPALAERLSVIAQRVITLIKLVLYNHRILQVWEGDQNG